MKTFISIFAIATVMTLSGCYSPGIESKSTLRACELQKELFDYFTDSQPNAEDPYEIYEETHRRSLVIAQTAEEADALSFEYQSDFFAAMADPNLPGDWEPSQEMATANGDIAQICKAYGILF
jgi:hypothetical protein